VIYLSIYFSCASFSLLFTGVFAFCGVLCLRHSSDGRKEKLGEDRLGVGCPESERVVLKRRKNKEKQKGGPEVHVPFHGRDVEIRKEEGDDALERRLQTRRERERDSRPDWYFTSAPSSIPDR
jgi:hypothetical protein